MNEIKIQKERLGSLLKSIRKSNNISTYSMEGKGIHFKPLSSIEQGSTNYTIETLLRYCEAIGVNLVGMLKENFDDHSL